MRLNSRFVSSSFGIALAASLLVTGWQAPLRAADLDQLLQAAAEDAQPKADGEKSDKRPDASRDKPHAEDNGAKKNEDTAAKSTQKPSSDSATDKPKPKYPPYAELLKDTREA